MATGLEALGAASAVLQVISFAGTLATLCYKIYDGQSTVDCDIEEYASQTLQWAERVRARSQAMPLVTANEKELAEVAPKCLDAAKTLETQAQLLTKRHQKGKLLRAVYDSIRSSKHMGKIKKLQRSLKDYTQTMETHLLLSICDKNTAIEQQQSRKFKDLESDVQNLVSQIAKGYTSLEDLVKSEQLITRGIVAKEAETTREQVSTHITSECQALGTRETSDRQRERLLKSLKAGEMNQRYHQIMDPEDASFERVFASYECISRKDLEYKSWEEAAKAVSTAVDRKTRGEKVDKIDQVWSCFCSWLQSSDEMFWIRGKPGSGKSTLIKFLVHSDNTKRLLDSWSPGTKIISHFFWKIGTLPQNSIHGLLCSLLHQTLCERSDTVDRVLDQFAFSLGKDSCHDWSTRELERVLFFVLDSLACSTCIFIDGLDEISAKDGFLNLMGLVEKLQSRDKVKLCVSSRPETQLVNKLEAIGTKSLRLEDLTRPEMFIHVNKQLARYAENGQISASFLQESTDQLLCKAEGVFLWLFLATNSLTTGIENRDDETTLLRKLGELPRELEALYQQMWERLNKSNSVYRETAARYFRYAITSDSEVYLWRKGTHLQMMTNPTLGQFTLAEEIMARENFFPHADISLASLKQVCEATADNIYTRCAGMLQLRPSEEYSRHPSDQLPEEARLLVQEVTFIHRTAHDFFADTEAGQGILNYKHNTAVVLDMAPILAKSMICMAIKLHREFNLISDLIHITDACEGLIHGVDGRDVAMGLLPIINGLYEEGTFGVYRPSGHPPPKFLSHLATKSPTFDEFIISSVGREHSSSLATEVLRDVAGLHHFKYPPPTALIHQLLVLGANPHVPGMPVLIVNFDCRFTQKLTAFGLVLLATMDQLLSERPLIDMPALMSIINTMARTCPDWRRKQTILITKSLILSGWSSLSNTDAHVWGLCEVDLQFLLTRFLAAADFRKVSTPGSGLGALVASSTEPHVRIRYICPQPVSWLHPPEYCYRIVAQQPFQGLIDYIFGPRDGSTMSYDDFCALVNALGHSGSHTDSFPALVTYEKVTYQSQMEVLAGEGLGLYKLSDLGIIDTRPRR